MAGTPKPAPVSKSIESGNLTACWEGTTTCSAMVPNGRPRLPKPAANSRCRNARSDAVNDSGPVLGGNDPRKIHSQVACQTRPAVLYRMDSSQTHALARVPGRCRAWDPRFHRQQVHPEPGPSSQTRPPSSILNLPLPPLRQYVGFSGTETHLLVSYSETYRAVHGCGSQPEASASFLKWLVVTNGTARYVGSSTTVMTMSQVSAFGSLNMS